MTSLPDLADPKDWIAWVEQVDVEQPGFLVRFALALRARQIAEGRWRADPDAVYDAAPDFAVDLALQDLVTLRDGPPAPLCARLDWLALRLVRQWKLFGPLVKTQLALLAADEDFQRARRDWPVPPAVRDKGERPAVMYQVVREALVDLLYGETPSVKLETALSWASLPRSRWLKNGVLTLAKQRLARLAPARRSTDPLEHATSLDDRDSDEHESDAPGSADVLLGSGALDALVAVETGVPGIEQLIQHLARLLTEPEFEYLTLWDPAGEDRTNREICSLMGISEGAGAGRRGIRARVEGKLAEAAAAAM